MILNLVPSALKAEPVNDRSEQLQLCGTLLPESTELNQQLLFPS
jgi:hypothetical protein